MRANTTPRWTVPAWLAAAAGLLIPSVALPQQEAVPRPEDATVAPPVEVTAAPIRIVTPLPGVVMDERQMTTNVQTVTAEEIRKSRAVSPTQFMNERLQSVTVNDYSGNPFQQDVNFRGFSASPLVATPQGLSVYLDGVRVNEPFGDVVNWDLIPLNAIEGMDLIPGSNPLFGLNTLGGALAVTTKSGFTAPGVDAQALTGSWSRNQVQLTGGANNGTVAGLIAFNGLREDGWRDNSSSELNQLFGRLDVRGRLGQITLSALYADNSLTGNGTVPYEDYQKDASQIYTSPDQVNNRVTQVGLTGRLDLSDSTSLTLMGYYRQLTQSSQNGDFWDEWSAAANGRTDPCPTADSTYADGAIEVDAPGYPDCIPNGVFNYGTSNQSAYGFSAQFSWLTERNQLVVGASYDSNDVDFSQTQQLGWIGDNRDVYLDPNSALAATLVAMREKIVRNRLNGSSQTLGLYFLDVVSPKPSLNLSFGGRYNYSRVKNDLESDLPIPLYQFTPTYLANREAICGAPGNSSARFQCSAETFTYEAFNPALGVSWLPNPRVNLFANWSQGSRTPSAIELGCARDRKAEQGVSTGKYQGCSIPTSLTNDPYLPQVRSTSYELGARGNATLGGWALNWNTAAFRTDLQDDILFVALGQGNRGVFDTFGQTRRQGLELGLGGARSRYSWFLNYTLLDATFQDPATVVNRSNSTSSKVQGVPNEFVIEPGDRIPGIPRNSVRAGFAVDITSRLSLGLNMIAQSSSYVRGNENNDHVPQGTDSDGSAVTARNDPTITVSPGRAYVGEGKIDGFAVFNLSAGYRLTDRWSVFLQVDNLFDEDYVTAGQLGLNSFTTSRWGQRDAAGFNYNSYDWTHSQFVGPGAPRAAWIGISYSSRSN
jgi:iron complex outermembrane receptor protein